MKQKRLNARMKNAMIPSEFKNAEFKNYKTFTPTQRSMLDKITAYLSQFEKSMDNQRNSFGFIAKYGEQRLREIRDPVKRAILQRKHNNFGIGKTHLQVAAAKELIRRGYTVLIVSDVTFMEELAQSRMYDDEGETFSKLLWAAINCDVLVWDDIGKSKPTEAKSGYYYRIIDERYRNHSPIIFSSNEDKDTLSERLGGAAASRLFGMSMDWLFEVEGADYRLSGAV